MVPKMTIKLTAVNSAPDNQLVSTICRNVKRHLPFWLNLAAGGTRSPPADPLPGFLPRPRVGFDNAVKVLRAGHSVRFEYRFHTTGDVAKADPLRQKGLNGDFVGSVQRRRRCSSLPARTISQCKARKALKIGRLKGQRG